MLDGGRSLPREAAAGSLIPFGNGRSYGDSAQNPAGALLDTRGMCRVLGLDSNAGVVRAEAGLRLGALIDAIVPEGWMLPVCPGTAAVTLGGAVAHDVHGKNQARAGNFGRHVRRLRVLRSTEGEVECSAEQRPELFHATLGGLGLTGLVTEVELQLERLPSAGVDVQVEPVATFEALAAGPQGASHEFTWVDGFRAAGAPPRALRFTADPSEGAAPERQGRGLGARLVSLALPVLFNRHALGALNRLYHRAERRRACRKEHLLDFLFPQDRSMPGNRYYGRRGVYAYHCLLPAADARPALEALFARPLECGQPSLSTTVKAFGSLRSPALLAFDGEGTSVALGFENRGARTLALLGDLDAIVREAGGKLYPAKDYRLPREMFRASFPRWEEFARQVDPRFESSLWRRVAGG